MDKRQLTSEDCQPSVGMIGEGTRKDGRHDGERPWFKNEMGEVVHGSVEKRRPLLIVVADHGKSGDGSRSRSQSELQRVVAVARHGIFPSANQ